jgi:peptide chain release factor 1
MKSTIVLEIRAAEGGTDSKLLVEDMTEIYVKSIRQQNFTVENMEINDGFALFTIKGDNVRQFYINEIGIHTWQRVPPTERNGRVHTSIVTVAVMDPADKTNYKINPDDVETTYTRGTGPGGQHRNTTNSCVVLRHKPTDIQVRIDGRKQHQNEKLAWEQLQIRLNNWSSGIKQQNSAEFRREQIGTGGRGDKRRTYRVKDDLVIDHVSNKRTSLKNIQKGKIDLLHNRS